MSAVEPTFFFSLRSPYSWLAWKDMRQLYPKLLERLRLVPFWEPGPDYQSMLGANSEAFLYTAMSKEKHLYILTDVKRQATRRGLSVSWPVDRQPQWEVPHLAWFVADSAGKGRQYIDAICDMRWKHGRDICDPATVAEVGVGLGMSGTALRDAHLDPELRGPGLHALRSCIRDGVFGVPFFSIGREKYWGLDRLHDFIGAVAHATLPLAPVETASETPNRAVQDHAGGCG